MIRHKTIFLGTISMMTIYGIPNCTTMKKTFAWCVEQGVPYAFHDYRKHGVDASRLAQWCQCAGWSALINRRGTTWRALPAERQAIASDAQAIELMCAYPGLIRRPVVETGHQLLIGFDPALFTRCVK